MVMDPPLQNDLAVARRPSRPPQSCPTPIPIVTFYLMIESGRSFLLAKDDAQERGIPARLMVDAHRDGEYKCCFDDMAPHFHMASNGPPLVVLSLRGRLPSAPITGGFIWGTVYNAPSVSSQIVGIGKLGGGSPTWRLFTPASPMNGTGMTPTNNPSLPPFPLNKLRMIYRMNYFCVFFRF